MAILKDVKQNGNYVELSIKRHIPGESEGSRMYFQYVELNRMQYELEFGWTNMVVESYIEATSQFPLPQLHGLYSSFEKHLYELSWINIDMSNDQYKLHFYGSDQDFELITLAEDIRTFGNDLNAEWQHIISIS